MYALICVYLSMWIDVKFTTWNVQLIFMEKVEYIYPNGVKIHTKYRRNFIFILSKLCVHCKFDNLDILKSIQIYSIPSIHSIFIPFTWTYLNSVLNWLAYNIFLKRLNVISRTTHKTALNGKYIVLERNAEKYKPTQFYRTTEHRYVFLFSFP